MKRIAALGGGGFSMEPRNARLDRWLLSLTGKRRPRVTTSIPRTGVSFSQSISNRRRIIAAPPSKRSGFPVLLLLLVFLAAVVISGVSALLGV